MLTDTFDGKGKKIGKRTQYLADALGFAKHQKGPVVLMTQRVLICMCKCFYLNTRDPSGEPKKKHPTSFTTFSRASVEQASRAPSRNCDVVSQEATDNRYTRHQ